MSRAIRYLGRAALRLYPSAWRARYEDEVLDLLDEIPPRPPDVVDLVKSAAVQHTSRLPPDAGSNVVLGAVALLSLALVIPSALFVTLNLLQYQFGILVDDQTAWWIANSSGATTLLGHAGGPLLSLGLAAVVLARPTLSRSDAGELILTTRLRRSLTAMLAMAVSILTLAIVIGYGVSENVLEALR